MFQRNIDRKLQQMCHCWNFGKIQRYSKARGEKFLGYHVRWFWLCLPPLSRRHFSSIQMIHQKPWSHYLWPGPCTRAGLWTDLRNWPLCPLTPLFCWTFKQDPETLELLSILEQKIERRKKGVTNPKEKKDSQESCKLQETVLLSVRWNIQNKNITSLDAWIRLKCFFSFVFLITSHSWCVKYRYAVFIQLHLTKVYFYMTVKSYFYR